MIDNTYFDHMNFVIIGPNLLLLYIYCLGMFVQDFAWTRYILVDDVFTVINTHSHIHNIAYTVASKTV